MARIRFDASTVEPSTGFSAIAKGDHLMMIVDSEMRETKMGNGEGLNLTFEVLDGDFKGQKAFMWLNLKHENAQAVEISQRNLSAICHAVGKIKVEDSIELHDIPLVVTMIKDRNDPDRTVPGGFKSANGAAAPVGVTTRASAPPKTASATPPWQKKAA